MMMKRADFNKQTLRELGQGGLEGKLIIHVLLNITFS